MLVLSRVVVTLEDVWRRAVVVHVVIAGSDEMPSTLGGIWVNLVRNECRRCLRVKVICV